MSRTKSIATSKSTKNGGGCIIVFAIIWTAFSCLFLVLMGRSALDELRVEREAVRAPCKISNMEIVTKKNNNNPFSPKVEFTYEWQNKTQKGSKLWRTKKDSEQYEEVFTVIQRLKQSEQDWCYVDPKTGDAFLLPVDAKNLTFFLIFPALFVAIGIGLLFVGIKALRKSKSTTAISSKAKSGSKFGCLFFSVFAIAGIFMGIFLWSKAWRDLEVKNWVQTDAEVIWSRVKTHKGSENTTYSVDIFYKYTFDNQTYRSNRYKISETSSSGRSKKTEVVKAHPKGTKLTCYVNPQEPWRAIIDRNYGWGALFLLFPILFFGAGVGGMIYMLRRGNEEPDSRGDETRAEQVQALEKKLKQSPRKEIKGRWGGVIFLLIFAIFWNGMIYFFLFKSGDDSLFLKIFMIPFVLGGIAVVYGFFYCLIGLFSPHYEMSLIESVETEGASPGSEVEVSWDRKGGVGQPSRLRIWLVGEEEATYRRGTDTVTDNSVFYEKLIEDQQAPVADNGKATVRVPFDLPPTFFADNNKIKWYFVLSAEVARRPNFRLEELVHVLPYEKEDFL